MTIKELRDKLNALTASGVPDDTVLATVNRHSSWLEPLHPVDIRALTTLEGIQYAVLDMGDMRHGPGTYGIYDPGTGKYTSDQSKF